eukprot:gene8245-9128_t
MDPSEHWERSENANGIPYYMNHVTQQTSWNHPLINNLEKSLGTFNKIKYAAYRTASKLRAIQKAICSCSLEISTLIEFFEMQNLDKSSSPKETITPKRLEQTLRQLCLHQAKKSSNFTKDPLLAAELLLNWILNIHDRSRKGILRLLSVKISLIIVCNGSQRQKYYYIFSQMQNELGCMNREILGFFLQSCLKIPKYLGEEFYFGRSSIEPAIENFFDQAIDAYEAMGSDFVNWMLAEPQPLVWIPTLYRLAASETTKHEAKCNICKLFPVIGFRYKCLQCFNFDLCQECFWTGRVTKTHKFNHPIQEYCLTSSRGSDIKDVQKMFKNKVLKALSRKKRKESKKRFTEIQPDQQSVKSSNRDYEDDVYSEPSNYQAASEYGEDANDAGIQNNKSSDAQDGGLNSWDPNQQPLSRSKSQDSLPASSVDHDNNEYSSLQRENTLDGEAKLIASPLSKDQKREMERLLTALENDNRQLKNEIETIRGDNESRESEKSGLIQNNTRLRLEKRRMEERQGMLEEHNRQLELQMQKLRLLLQQGLAKRLAPWRGHDQHSVPMCCAEHSINSYISDSTSISDSKLSNPFNKSSVE